MAILRAFWGVARGPKGETEMLKVSFTIPLVVAYGLALAACDQQPSSDSSQSTDPQSQQQSAGPSDSAAAGEEKTE